MKKNGSSPRDCRRNNALFSKVLRQFLLKGSLLTRDVPPSSHVDDRVALMVLLVVFIWEACWGFRLDGVDEAPGAGDLAARLEAFAWAKENDFRE